MSDADSQQAGLLAIAALIVALKTWHGWRIGMVRQAIGLGALVVAVFAGVIGAPMVEPMIGPLLAVPDAARGPIAGVGLGVLVYLAITLTGAVLFKKTEHQTVGVIRLGYGFGGAVLGAVVGLLLATVMLAAFLAANGKPEIAEHLRDGEFEKALASVTGKTDKKPGHPHRR